MKKRSISRNNPIEDMGTDKYSFDNLNVGVKKNTKENSHTTWKYSTVVFWFFIIFVIVIFSIFFLAYFKLGFSRGLFPHHDFISQTPKLDSSVLEIVAVIDTPPGNIAVSASERIFLSLHPLYGHPFKVVELVNKTSYIPYPNLEYQKRIVSCLSLRIDSNDHLWILDHGENGLIGSPKLINIQLAQYFSIQDENEDNFVYEYVFPKEVAGAGSFLNDFQVDPSGDFIYIVDTSFVANTPAIIIFDVTMKKSYRILHNHPTLFGDSYYLNIKGTKLGLGPFGFKVNVDSIAIDRTGDKLYYSAVTSDKMYSIPTNLLLSYMDIFKKYNSKSRASVLEEEIIRSIILVSDRMPASDGLTSDNEGNIWITAFEHSAIAMAKFNATTGLFFKTYDTANIINVVQDSKLLQWPDGFSFGPSGLYITNSNLNNKVASPFDSRDSFFKKYGPFTILKIPTYSLKTIGMSEIPIAGH